MKKYRCIGFLLSIATIFTISPNINAEPIIGKSQLDTMGEVASSQQAFIAALPDGAQKVEDINIDTVYAKNKTGDANTIGKMSHYGKAALDIRLNKYQGYTSPEDLSISYLTETDIKKGDICVISFIAQKWWSPDGKTFQTKFGITSSDGSNVQKTDVIKAEANGSDNAGTFEWADKTYYAFESNADYNAGSKFEIYLGFNDGQQGAIRNVELRNLKNEKSLKLIQYVTGQTKLSQRQIVTFAPSSGFRQFSANDSINVKFTAPVSSDFVLNDFTIEGKNDASVESFVLSEDRKMLTLNIRGMLPSSQYTITVDNIITEDIDYIKQKCEFTTTESFVIDTTRISGLIAGTTKPKENVAPLALRLKRGTNTVMLNVNNSGNVPETAYMIATVYNGSKSNFEEAVLSKVYISKKTDIESFDKLSIYVPVEGANQVVKIFVWDNLINKTPLCDDIILSCTD